MQTVSTSEALSAAKPLTQTQANNKGKVWLIMVGAASGLFAATLLVENNTNFFPAIKRANTAMAAQRQAAGEGAEAAAAGEAGASTGSEAKQTFEEAEMQARSEEAVLKGLQAARDRVSQSEKVEK